MKKVNVILVLMALAFQSLAQSGNTSLIFHAGANGLIARVPDYDFIRGETAAYYDDEAYKNLRGYGSSWYGGLNIERQSKSGKFNVSVGVRYKGIRTSISKNWWSTSSSGHFYLVYDENGTTTEYLRVEGITQTSHYVGVPLEVRYRPFGKHRFTVYFMGGVETDFRLQTRTDTDFRNEGMERFNDGVADKMGAARDVVVLFNTAVGVEIGKEARMPVRIEMGPSAFLSTRTSSLVETYGAFNVALSVCLPL